MAIFKDDIFDEQSGFYLRTLVVNMFLETT